MGKIKRRLRRFYRKVEDGEIKYDKNKSNSKSDINIPKDNKNADISDIKENLKEDVSNEENLTRREIMDRKKLIDKILQDMKDDLNPSDEKLSEIIYKQLNNNNVKVDRKIIDNAVTKSKHYRASKGAVRSKKPQTSNKPKKTPHIHSKMSRAEKREKLRTVVDNVYDQVEKSKIKEKNKKDKNKKESKESEKSEKSKKSKKKKSKKEHKSKKSKKKKSKKEHKSKKSKEDKKKEKKNGLDLDLDFEDDLDLSDSEDEEKGNELGLKF